MTSIESFSMPDFTFRLRKANKTEAMTLSLGIVPS